MENFKDIKYSFQNTRNVFCQNVKDQVGASIDSEQLEHYEQTLNLMIGIEEKVLIETQQINTLLLEARTILPRI